MEAAHALARHGALSEAQGHYDAAMHALPHLGGDRGRRAALESARFLSERAVGGDRAAVQAAIAAIERLRSDDSRDVNQASAAVMARLDLWEANVRLESGEVDQALALMNQAVPFIGPTGTGSGFTRADVAGRYGCLLALVGRPGDAHRWLLEEAQGAHAAGLSLCHVPRRLTIVRRAP